MSLCFKLLNLIIVEQEPPVRVNTFTIVAMTRSDLIASKGLSQSIGITPSCLPSLRNKSGNQKNQPVRLSKVPDQELGRLVSHTAKWTLFHPAHASSLPSFSLSNGPPLEKTKPHKFNNRV
jgi:hypothetical protein